MRRLFGKIAVARGFMSDEQLTRVLETHSQEHSSEDARRRRLGEIAIALGFMEPTQVGELLELQKALLSEEADEIGQRLRVPQGRFTGHATKPPVLPGLFQMAHNAGASDLHLHAGQVPFVRRHGKLVRGVGTPPDSDHIAGELKDLLDDDQLGKLDSDGQLDLCVTIDGGVRLRTNLFYERNGLCASIRFVPPEVPTLESLNLPGELAGLTNFPQGLVLVSGPAGCGKTTTLAALVQLISSERADHILCLEDPIEFIFPRSKSTITQREIGRHTVSSHAALRAALREDPDVIVISELRDPATISLALSAAETGHLVMGTLHTTSVEGTITRILDAFSGDEEAQVRAMLSESLRGIVAQRLIPSAHGGVVPLVELLFGHTGVATCIRDRKLNQLESMMQTGQRHNMITKDGSLSWLLGRGLITKETADHVVRQQQARETGE